MDLAQAALTLKKFGGSDLTLTLGKIESSVRGLRGENCAESIATLGASKEVLVAAGLLKAVAGQINVVIHALGILLCIPHILEKGELIENVSLGAGNSGRAHDLETSHRIAEFKFIRWRGHDAVRENSLFKDYFSLAASQLPKRKYLYLLGTDYPLKFLNGGRALSSVLTSHRLKSEFEQKCG
ncbi:MAG: hypothetical protein ACREES_09225, partial [Stellaceae bacterium]